MAAMLYEDSELLSEGLLRYYQANGLPLDGGINDRWARYSFGPFQAIAFPNFQLRNEALRRHDIHHVLNNLDTSPLGEGLIAAWELGSGCGRFWISWFMESQALWWGILLAPRLALAFFAAGRKSRNYFTTYLDDNLQSKRIGELRAQMLASPKDNLLSNENSLRFAVVAALGILCMTVFIPVACFFTLFGLFAGLNRAQ